jgi:hypothetical protein
MWIFNVFLYLMFISNPVVYRELKQVGAPCYAYHSDHGERPDSPPPPCFYDLAPRQVERRVQ